MHEERTARTDIGHIGVDTGTVWVGDPCYLNSGHTPEQWTALVNETFAPYHAALAAAKTEEERNKAFNTHFPHVTELHSGLWINTLYGDGTYCVTLEKNRYGQVIRFTVDFTQGNCPDNDEEPSDEQIDAGF